MEVRAIPIFTNHARNLKWQPGGASTAGRDRATWQRQERTRRRQIRLADHMHRQVPGAQWAKSRSNLNKFIFTLVGVGVF